jgi:hypothetical protein
MMDIVQSLWIGPKLSKLEHLSIKSFIDHGHEYHLYTYGEVKNVPKGAIVKDGNDILPESEIFRYQNGSVSAFSNLFRYTMLYKKGGYWVDTDVICVRPLDYKEDFVIASEPVFEYTDKKITSFLIKIKKGSEISKEAIKIQREHKKLILSGQMQWGSGPLTTNHIVEKYKLHKYILPWNATCSCAWDQGQSIFNPNFKPNPKVITKITEIPKDMKIIHMWNEVLRRTGLDKNATFHPESLFEIFKRRHKIS